MWWDKFEISLANVFVIVDKDAGRQVHTDKLKPRLLNKNLCRLSHYHEEDYRDADESYPHDHDLLLCARKLQEYS